MEQGLRVVGTVEFGGLDNPLSKSRVKNLINNANRYGDQILIEKKIDNNYFIFSIHDDGPFTGQISAYQLSRSSKQLKYCLVGHSEVRSKGDSNSIVRKKSQKLEGCNICLLYTSPSPRDGW